MMPWAPILVFMVASPLFSPEGTFYTAGLFGWPFALAAIIASSLQGLTGGLVAGLYVAAALFIYNSCGWLQLNEIIRIPLIEYLLVFVLAGLIALGLWVAGTFRKKSKPVELISERENGLSGL